MAIKYVTKSRRVRRLTAPLDFLRIKHPEKIKYDYVYPIILTTSFMLLYYTLPIRPSVVLAGGLFEDVQQLLSLLFPFFVAALAAVASYQRPSLDEYTSGPRPVTLHEDGIDKALTRRRVVCYMFGYLSFLSLILLLYIFAAKLVTPSLIMFTSIYAPYVKFLGLLIFASMLSNLIITTLWGLFYLTDRLHRD